QLHPAPAPAEPLHQLLRIHPHGGAVRVRLELHPLDVRGRQGGDESLAGGHAGVDHPLAAAAPQLRRHPHRAAGAARVRRSRGARAPRARLDRPGGAAARADPGDQRADRGRRACMSTAVASVLKYRPRRSAADATAWLGMVVFLASWTMLFAALFAVYAVLRVRAPAWPPPDLPRLPLLLPGANTLAIVASGIALQSALHFSRTGRVARVLPAAVAALV